MPCFLTVSEIKKNYDFNVEVIHAKSRDATNKLIDQCYEYYNSKLFDFSVPASRNLYQSSVYHNFYVIYMMDELWNHHDINIQVDSLALYVELKKLVVSKNKKVKISLNVLSYAKQMFKPLLRIWVTFYRMCKTKQAADQFGESYTQLRSDKDLIFVDTNIAEGFFNQGGYSDRYYGALFDLLNGKDKEKIIIMPNYSAAKNLQTIRSEYVKYAENAHLRIFNKETLLSYKDYFCILVKLIASAVLFFKRNPVAYSSFVREELFLKSFSTMSFEAFVSYEAFRSDNFKQISIKTFLLWYENHLYDRAYFSAYIENKLKFNLKAYQPLLDADYEFFIEPTQTEISRGLVLGNRLKTGSHGVPLFRLARYLDHQTKYVNVVKQQERILVALSLIPRLCENVMVAVVELAKENPEYQFVIRCHPLLKWPLPKGVGNLEYDVETDIVLSLKKSILFIGTGSVTVLEAAILGLPVVIVQSEGETIQCHVPQEYRNQMVTVFDMKTMKLKPGNIDFLANVLNKAHVNKNQISETSQILYDMFVAQINKKNILDILN